MSCGDDLKLAVKLMDEICEYFECNKAVLLSEDEKDLFQLFFDLGKRAALVSTDIDTVREQMDKLVNVIKSADLYEESLIETRIGEYENCAFEGIGDEGQCENDQIGLEDMQLEMNPEEEDEEEDCLANILHYAGYKENEIETISNQVINYRELPDILATDDETRKLRRGLSKIFYETYTRVLDRKSVV